MKAFPLYAIYVFNAWFAAEAAGTSDEVASLPGSPDR